MINLTILGTSASAPTINRGLSSASIENNGSIYLFDCGEGTQRQMLKFKINISKIKCIFITHTHADHVLGIAVVLFILLLMNPGILNSAKTNYNLFYFSSSNLNVGKTVHFYFGEAFLFMFAVINFVILNYIYSNKIDSYFIKKEFNVDNVMHEVVGDDTPRF